MLEETKNIASRTGMVVGGIIAIPIAVHLLIAGTAIVLVCGSLSATTEFIITGNTTQTSKMVDKILGKENNFIMEGI
jgi:esterase/lipase